MHGGCTAVVSFSVVPARIRRHRLSDKGDGRFESCPLAGESTANLTSSVMHTGFSSKGAKKATTEPPISYRVALNKVRAVRVKISLAFYGE